MDDRFDPWIDGLGSYWDLSDGAMYRLRQGKFDVAGIDDLIGFLRTISIPDDATIPKRLVSLLWIMPTFMEWQIDRVIEHGGSADELRKRIVLVRNELERILGGP